MNCPPIVLNKISKELYSLKFERQYSQVTKNDELFKSLLCSLCEYLYIPILLKHNRIYYKATLIVSVHLKSEGGKINTYYKGD